MPYRRLFFMLLIIGCATLPASADMNKVGDHNIGAGAGFVTGYGLSYRQWIGSWGFQLTTAPYHREYDNSSTTTISIGGTALKKIKEAKLVNLFAYLGPHYFFSRETSTYSSYFYEPFGPGTTSETKSISQSKILFVGGGPGLDFHFLRISFSLMCGFTGHHDFESKESGIHFTGESALYYSF
jgi:hypothetical protein